MNEKISLLVVDFSLDVYPENMIITSKMRTFGKKRGNDAF